MQKLSERKAEKFCGVRVQLGKSWCVWRQRCSAPDTSVSGDQKMSSTEEAAEADAEANSWAEVMAAVGMAANAADSRAKAGAVQAENSLFQSMGAEETAASIAIATATLESTMGMAATTVAEQTAIRKYNPLFQSMGTEEAMAVADRGEEVAAVEMAVTAMEAAADTTANTTVAATSQDTAQESTEEQAIEEQATATAQDTTQEEEAEFGGGASGRQIWDQSRVFDPGTLRF
jgi:hypothetical protein